MLYRNAFILHTCGQQQLLLPGQQWRQRALAIVTYCNLNSGAKHVGNCSDLRWNFQTLISLLNRLALLLMNSLLDRKHRHGNHRKISFPRVDHTRVHASRSANIQYDSFSKFSARLLQ